MKKKGKKVMTKVKKIKRGFAIQEATVRRLVLLKAETRETFGEIIDRAIEKEFKSHPGMKQYDSRSKTISA